MVHTGWTERRNQLMYEVRDSILRKKISFTSDSPITYCNINCLQITRKRGPGTNWGMQQHGNGWFIGGFVDMILGRRRKNITIYNSWTEWISFTLRFLRDHRGRPLRERRTPKWQRLHSNLWWHQNRLWYLSECVRKWVQIINIYVPNCALKNKESQLS